MAQASSPKNNTASKPFGFNDAQIKLVIYDFDQTITSLHLYRQLAGGEEDALEKMTDETLLQVFGGSDRQKRLITHFERIASKSEIAIISFGWLGVIKNALKRIGLEEYFKNQLIIGKDSEEFKNASGSKGKCISRIKKKRTLKSNEILFVDDDKANLTKAQSYCQTVLISPRNGMTFNHMKQIEENVGVYPTNPFMELTTPKTVNKETTKHYPQNDHNKKKNLAQYAIKNVPQWFDQLSSTKDTIPVIQIGGDQTPVSDDEFELNVPILNDKLNEIVNTNKNKNGIGLALNTDVNTDDEEEEDKSKHIKFKLSLDPDK